ncbi:MAG: Ig-like domain-containing protein, partial [Caldimonas sp.]
MISFQSLGGSPLRLFSGVLVAFVAACGGGGLDPILGTPTLVTITDTTRPTVVLTVPAPGAVNVPTNTKITAVFSEAMAPASLVGTTFTVINTTLGTAVAGAVSYSASARTVTFTPTTPATLTANSTFTATVTTAATDLAGNALAGNSAVLP